MASLAAVVDDVVQRHLDLAWGWWTAMGVPGARHTPMETALHPEALVVFSASLIAHDTRLRQGIIGWILANQRHIGGRQILAVANRLPGVPGAMANFSATLAAAGGPKLAGHGVGVPIAGHIDALDRPLRLERPSLALLRLRVALGHHARSEVLAVLAGDRAPARTHGDLSRYIASTPRNVRLALEDLVLADVLTPVAGPGGQRYRCRRRDALQEWVGPIPRMPPWVTLLPAVTAFRRALTDVDNDLERAVNVRRVLDHHAGRLAWLDLPELPRGDGRGLASAMAQWLLDTAPLISEGGGELPR